MLTDGFQRTITYLRLSLTDLCNLRCRYCMPEEGVAKMRHGDILSYEEMLRLVTSAAMAGIRKIRLTGGEPLIRKGVLTFIDQLAHVPGITDLRITTNGTLLAPLTGELVSAGVKAVNISLDSLDPATYARITGKDVWKDVWAGIETSLKAGFRKVKLNCVVIRGENDHELAAFAELTRRFPLDVRFIELMPLGRLEYWANTKVVTAMEMRQRIERVEPLEPVTENGTGVEGPARLFRFPGAPGRVGFISPLSDHFCRTCNRLRLTADGKIRVCLLSDLEIDARKPLRDGAGLEELVGIWHRAAGAKPGDHGLVETEGTDLMSRPMHRIGG